MNAAAINGVIETALAGSIGGRKFSKIIYVGHSEGSLVGNEFAQLYPDVVDSFVLTGFTPHLLVGALGTVIGGGFAPAPLIDPAKSKTQRTQFPPARAAHAA